MKHPRFIFTQLFFFISIMAIAQINNGEKNEKQYSEDNRPLLQRIEGIWISDYYTTEDFSGLPSYILVVKDGTVKLDMIGYGFAKKLSSNSQSNIPPNDRVTAQYLIDNETSLLVVWSNERLKEPDPTIAAELEQMGSEVSHELTKYATSDLFGESFIGELGSNIVSGVVANAVSNMITNAFTPSKRMVMLGMTIKQNNELELTANVDVQEIYVKGDNKPTITKKNQFVHFTKYDPASGVFFDIPYIQKIYIPGEGLVKEISSKYQEIGESYTKYYDLRVPTHISKTTLLSQQNVFSIKDRPANPFNRFQIKKLQYYNEQKILGQGIVHSESKPFLGVEIKLKEDKNGTQYCCVSRTHPSSPAYLFDLQEGDFLLSINGFEVNTPEQAIKMINSFNPFEWINMRLKRGRKTIDIEVELSK